MTAPSILKDTSISLISFMADYFRACLYYLAHFIFFNTSRFKLQFTLQLFSSDLSYSSRMRPIRTIYVFEFRAVLLLAMQLQSSFWPAWIGGEMMYSQILQKLMLGSRSLLEPSSLLSRSELLKITQLSYQKQKKNALISLFLKKFGPKSNFEYSKD